MKREGIYLLLSRLKWRECEIMLFEMEEEKKQKRIEEVLAYTRPVQK